MTLAKALTRLLAIATKELTEIARQPGALITLVFGPFLIMLVFGLGYTGFRPPIRAVVVIAPGSGLGPPVQAAATAAEPDVVLVALVETPDEGRAMLASGQTDLVVIPPIDPVGTFRSGQRSTINVEFDTVDPVKAGFANAAASAIEGAVNRAVVERAVAEGQSTALADGATGLAAIPPEVIAAPTQAQPRDLAPTEPRIVSWFGPAMIALILQHMALTLAALSLVRERLSGQMDRFRVAPVSALEIIGGKLLAFVLLVGVTAALMTWALIAVLGVPMLGAPVEVAAVIGLLIVASATAGLFFGAISGSERQAVQFSLLALLAAVFFGGLIVPVTQLSPIAAAVAYVIPVTYALATLQQLLLSGSASLLVPVVGLTAIALVCGGLSWLILRRSLAPA